MGASEGRALRARGRERDEGDMLVSAGWSKQSRRRTHCERRRAAPVLERIL